MTANASEDLGKPLTGWRLQLYTIIFEADTRAGRLFDQALIAIILASVLVVMLDSVQSLDGHLDGVFVSLAWLFTLAVPTGIVTAEMTAQRRQTPPTTRTCHECLSEGHLPEASFCHQCGARLAPYQTESPTGDTP
ncbi:MAG: hypothetical protein U1E84_06805 [Rhodoferax sp.]